MSDPIDELLHAHGNRWAAAQPAPPPLDAGVRRATAQPDHRRRVAVAAAIATIAAIAAVPTIRSLTGDTNHPPAGSLPPANASSSPAPSTPSATTLAAPVLRELIRRARSTATAEQDPNATGEAVRTTYRDAERVVLDGSTSSNPPGATRVWVIQLHGSFTCLDCTGPAGGPSPTGTAIALIINARTYTGYDFAITKAPHDLGKLGEVIQLPM
jgi:hypothetical protein